MYYDLAVKNSQNVLKTVAILHELGYSGCAITQTIKNPTNKSFLNLQTTNIQLKDAYVYSVFLNNAFANTLRKNKKGEFSILNRLNVVLNTAAEYNSFNDYLRGVKSNSKQFDIISLNIQNEKVLSTVLGLNNPPVDIIVLPIDELVMPFHFKKSQMKRGKDIGILFEIDLSPIVMCPELMPKYVSNIKSVLRYANSSNLLVSCGSSEPMSVRSPSSILNLLAFLGIRDLKVCNSIFKDNIQKLLERSIIRKNKCIGMEVIA